MSSSTTHDSLHNTQNEFQVAPHSVYPVEDLWKWLFYILTVRMFRSHVLLLPFLFTTVHTTLSDIDDGDDDYDDDDDDDSSPVAGCLARAGRAVWAQSTS